MRTIKVGDCFKLGIWEWTVKRVISDGTFCATHIDICREERICNHGEGFTVEDADSLDWLEPPVTISKRAAEEIKSNLISPLRLAAGMQSWHDDALRFIDSITAPTEE